MHPIENILKTTMAELREMVDVNTIVGSPFVAPNGTSIIPISKVSFGFVSGGGEYGQMKKKGQENENEADYPFASATTSGVCITPVAFMVADSDCVKLLTVSKRNALDKLIENAPTMISEIKSFVCSGMDNNLKRKESSWQDDKNKAE